ncbi:MAG: hypothetical protein NTV43_12395 [Methylococcales bacterium]|nr:hypothetical protein [Methylococcales bacterium]
MITQSSEDTQTVGQEMILADVPTATGQNITLLTRKERKLIKAKRKKKN